MRWLVSLIKGFLMRNIHHSGISIINLKQNYLNLSRQEVTIIRYAQIYIYKTCNTVLIKPLITD